MKASVIVLAWNGMDYLEPCLNAVFAQDYPDFEVIVVDNGSTDGSADFVAERFPQARLIRNERNLGYAAGNNVGLRAATGDVLVLLNQDTEVRPGWLRALVEALDDPTVGIVGCKLLYPDGTIQHAGARLADVRGSPEHIGHHEPDQGQYDQPRDVEFVTGAALGLTRLTLDRVGYLDEGFAPAYYEDVDWCYRAREVGLRTVYTPDAVAVHFESASRDHISDYFHRLAFHHGRLRLLLKHKPLDWLEQEFAPAEAAWVRQTEHMVETLSVRTAYLRSMFALPEILTFRAQLFGTTADQDRWERLLGLMVRLRDTCFEVRFPRKLHKKLDHIQEHAVGTRILRKDVGAEAFSQTGKDEDLLSALHAQWQIKEQPFHSDIPILGRFIAAFRSAWNNISTRWYVLPMVQQQVNFNSTATALLTQLVQHRNEIAVTQIAILSALREMLEAHESHIQATAQDVQREVDTIIQAVLDIRKRTDDIERRLG
ncbi:MAG: glycosyltransferase family 2 protein [Candidatus Hadarchaeum sp.]